MALPLPMLRCGQMTRSFLRLDLNNRPLRLANRVRLELLPVFSRPSGLSWLRPCGREAWRVPAADCSIWQTVLGSLAERRLQALVVHSTSWRQEADGVVMLTHLAVVRPPADVPDGFEERPVMRCPLARGDPTSPPPHVEIEQVLEHALRHLAWLARDDREVASALDGLWHRALQAYRPEPIRVFRAPAHAVRGHGEPPRHRSSPLARPGDESRTAAQAPKRSAG